MSHTTTYDDQPSRIQETLTFLICVFVLIAAGAGIFVSGFYDGIVDPLYATGTITADVVSLICVPLLIVCMVWARRSSPVARLGWIALVSYLAYAYATYVFDRMYTILFPLYMGIFSLSCFVVVSILTRLDVQQLAEYAQELRLRRVTSIFLVFTGLILYVIELPIILSRIPGGIHAGGTPFMVLDMSLVAPISILTGIWLWQRRPWSAALAAIFLIKATTLMSGFLIADYIDWYAGRLTTQGTTIAFTVVYLLVYFFTWNYFAAFSKKAQLVSASS
jgi:hypothetical protein